jgi:proteasome activator-like protein
MTAEEQTVIRGEPAARAGEIPIPSEDEAAQGNIEHPAKLLRLAVMVRELLEEVRRAPLDENARQHLRDIHAKVIAELKTGLSGALAEELERLSLPLPESGVPSESEIRIAQAQLLGWLEGLFQGIQAAIATQQMAAQAQLLEMRRRGLPPGAMEEAAQAPQRGESPPGQYL